MKYTAHVPVEQYGFIEVEADSAEDVITEYRSIKRRYEGGAGIGVKALAKVLAEYCKTGSIVNGHEYEFSAAEASLVNEVKKLLRKTN